MIKNHYGKNVFLYIHMQKIIKKYFKFIKYKF